MDRFKFTSIGHTSHRLCSPIGETRLAHLIECAALAEQGCVLDLAAGKAELTIRLIERYGVSGVAVDHSPRFVAEAQEEAARRGCSDRLTLIESDVAAYDAGGAAFDLVVCIGARPFGDREATLRACAGLASAGGKILIGEGYWKQPPADEFLSFLGCPAGDYGTHSDNIALGQAHGLTVVCAAECSVEEMDAYDGQYAANIEQYLEAHPDDPEAPAIRERITAWRAAYFRWVRATLGFGVYLFQT